EEALASYDKALAIQPNYPDALLSRGIALEALDRAAEALASYERALQIQPRSKSLLAKRGDSLQDLGRVEEAVKTYHSILATHPRRQHRGENPARSHCCGSFVVPTETFRLGRPVRQQCAGGTKPSRERSHTQSVRITVRFRGSGNPVRLRPSILDRSSAWSRG